MAHMTDRTCKWCKVKFQARTADVNRGWALFCSKTCKAMKQEKLTGQYRAMLSIGGEGNYEMRSRDEQREVDHQAARYESSSCHGQDPGDSF